VSKNLEPSAARDALASNTGEPVAEETHLAAIRVVMHRMMHRRRPANRSYVKSLVRSAVFCITWSMVHCRGNLSGRHRRNFVPWRKR
jgi:hypothetical protein